MPIYPAGQDENQLPARLPWIIETETLQNKSSRHLDIQPGLVKTQPRANDLLLISEGNLLEAASLIGNCSGMVLDLRGMPAINDAEIEAI